MTYGELSEAQAKRSRQFAEAQTSAMSVYCDAERDLKELQAENAELREFLTDLAGHIKHGDGHGADLCWVIDRMRELGIEVDG